MALHTLTVVIQPLFQSKVVMLCLNNVPRLFDPIIINIALIFLLAIAAETKLT